MKTKNRTRCQWGSWVASLIAFMSVLLIACGAAATATPQAASTPAPARTPEVTTTAATPAATPKATPAPAAVVVNPGKLTWMIAGWGAERFD